MSPSNSSDAAFAEAMADVKPIKKADTVQLVSKTDPLAASLKRQAIARQSRVAEFGLSSELIKSIDPHTPLSYQKPGVQHGVFKNLRLGKYPIESRLSMQGATVEVLMSNLVEDMRLAHKHGIRCLLIEQARSVSKHNIEIRSYLEQWLQDFPFVIAYHSATRQHGGLNSVYVLFKKNAEEKLKNRELQYNQKQTL